MKPLSFIIIGSGWRAMFFVRIAKRFPELFRLKYVLCRSLEKAEQISREQGVVTTISAEACEAANPDFVVIAVSSQNEYEVTSQWALKGFPVLCETPAGMNVEQLSDLWNLKVNHGAKIQIAEQYHRYPLVAAGLKRIREGALGEPYNVTLSLAHDYHGISLIRHMLYENRKNIASEQQLSLMPLPLELVKITGKKYHFPVRETDSRYGVITDGSVKERDRTVVALEFASGKTAFYDFSGVQYHSFIRARHINVQGMDGEWNDTMLRYVDKDYRAVEEKVQPYLKPVYKELETEELLREAENWNPFIKMSNAQDEYAIASMLFDMRAYIAGGKEVYPLAEALEDAYLWNLMKQAAEQPGTVTESRSQPWQV